METQELLTHATEFAFYPAGAEVDDVNGSHHRVTVVQRAPGRWAVIHMFQCWDGKDWVHESSPSNRTDKFKKKSRFPLDEAVEIALSMVDVVKVNGRTYAEWQELFKHLKEWDELQAGSTDKKP